MSIHTIIFINNAISSRMASQVVENENIDPKSIAVFSLLQVAGTWQGGCAEVWVNASPQERDILAHRRFAGFYRTAARRLRSLLEGGTVRRVLIVNNDNLLTAHVLAWAEHYRDIAVDVIAEGLMNYQDITIKNRQSWRWLVKPAVALALRLRWRTPRGHLSGAFDPVVRRIYAFTDVGLKAPPDKIHVISFPQVIANRLPARDTALLVHTGLWQWMNASDYRVFAQSFVDWLKEQGFSKILTKRHPHVATGVLADLLPSHQEIDDARPLEEMASDISAATVIGTCCTGLVTLKLMRPDIDCVDFGSDFYCPKAYHGDFGVMALMRASGVRIVEMAAFEGTRSVQAQ